MDMDIDQEMTPDKPSTDPSSTSANAPARGTVPTASGPEEKSHPPMTTTTTTTAAAAAGRILDHDDDEDDDDNANDNNHHSSQHLSRTGSPPLLGGGTPAPLPQASASSSSTSQRPISPTLLHSLSQQQLLQQPSSAHPSIPDEYLRCVVMPLYSADCSNRTFRNILTIIEHMGHLPTARETFLSQLYSAAVSQCDSVCVDLDRLMDILEVTEEEIQVQQLTLERFTPTDSNQAKLLRVLKTIDYIHTKKKTINNSLSTSNSLSHLPPSARLFGGMMGGGGGGSSNRVVSPTPSEVGMLGMVFPHVSFLCCHRIVPALSSNRLCVAIESSLSPSRHPTSPHRQATRSLH